MPLRFALLHVANAVMCVCLGAVVLLGGAGVVVAIQS